MYSTKIHYDKQPQHQSLLQQSSVYNTPTPLTVIIEKMSVVNKMLEWRCGWHI